MWSRVLQSQVLKPLSGSWIGHMRKYHLEADLEKNKHGKMIFMLFLHSHILANVLISEQNPRNITSNLKYKDYVTHLQY